MLYAILWLMLCQLAGELIRAAAHLPLPGPVIGMFLLAVILGARGQRAIPPALDKLAETLIAIMGLLFVPAGVGIMAHIDLFRVDGWPIVVALIGSTILGVAVTGLIMHWALRKSHDTDEMV